MVKQGSSSPKKIKTNTRQSFHITPNVKRTSTKKFFKQHTLTSIPIPSSPEIVKNPHDKKYIKKIRRDS